MRLHWLFPGLIGLALGIFSPRFATAQPEVSSTAVLGLEGIDVPPALTDDISEQLRQRVASTHDLRLVSGKDLVEVKLVFSCADESATCMAQAGKSLDAARMIYGSVKKAGEDYIVWLKMFDVRRGRIESGLTDTLPRKHADAVGIKAASGRWLAKLLGRPADAGTIQVTSNVFGAIVALDGVAVGATADQPLIIPDVAPGSHELVVTKAGLSPAKQQFILAAGQTVPVSLSPQTAASLGTEIPAQAVDTEGAQAGVGASTNPASRGTDNGRGGYRTGFWVTLAGGLVSAGAAVKFGLGVSDVNKKLDPYRRFPCMGGQLCDSKGVVKAPLTPVEKSQVGSLNDKGNHDQALQWICIGVGSVLGVASGYLFYKGYIDSDEEHPHHEALRGFRIFPTAGVSSSGILAEFDF
jgi:PEGA domain